HEEIAQFDLAGVFIFDARQTLTKDSERGRHDARRIARMHAFGEHAHFQRSGRDPAQARGEPEAFVIAAAGIETHHKRWRADARREMIDIGWQIVGPGFLAGLWLTTSLR